VHHPAPVGTGYVLYYYKQSFNPPKPFLLLKQNIVTLSTVIQVITIIAHAQPTLLFQFKYRLLCKYILFHARFTNVSAQLNVTFSIFYYSFTEINDAPHMPTTAAAQDQAQKKKTPRCFLLK
jgi:hypothetical protein